MFPKCNRRTIDEQWDAELINHINVRNPTKLLDAISETARLPVSSKGAND